MHDSVRDSVDTEDIRDLLDGRGDLVVLGTWLEHLGGDLSGSVGGRDDVLSNGKFLGGELGSTLDKVGVGDKSDVTINVDTKVDLDDVTGLKSWELKRKKEKNE